MVYKQDKKRGEKLVGSYYYESYHENGKVKKRYIGKRLNSNLKEIVVSVVILLTIVFLMHSVFGATGDIHISYPDNNLSGEFLGYCNNAGGSWTCSNISSLARLSSSIVLDSSNNVHVSIASTNVLGYCNNAGGSWTCETLDTSDVSAADTTSIARDSNDFLHISYHTGSPSSLKYCNNTGGVWTCGTVDSGGAVGVGYYNSIAIDSNDNVHISEIDSDNSKLKYCNNTGGVWTCGNVDPDILVDSSSSIAIDSNDNVHISLQDSTLRALVYCNNTGGVWTCGNLDDDELNNIGGENSIAIDSNDNVHISYDDASLGDLKYCNNTGGVWTCGTVDSAGIVGIYQSLAIDSNDNLHISQIDDTNNALRYCNNTGGVWTCGNLDDKDTPGSGHITSIFIEGQSSRSNLGSGSDATPPSVTINFPANTTYNETALPFIFNVSLGENGSIKYGLEHVPTGTEVNFTMLNSEDHVSTFGTELNRTNSSLYEGQYIFRVYANDTTGNKNYTENVRFGFDNSNPNVTGLVPSIVGTWFNVTNTIDIGANFSDLVGIQSGSTTANITLPNGTHFVLTLSNSQGNKYNVSYTISSGINGTANITFVALDTQGHKNATENTSFFILDNLAPTVTINVPSTTAYAITTSLNFNVSLNENGTADYSLDGGVTNISMLSSADGVSIFGTEFNYTNASVIAGTYVFSVYANDTFGNTNNTANVSYTVNAAAASSESTSSSGGGGGTKKVVTPSVEEILECKPVSCEAWSVCDPLTKKKTRHCSLTGEGCTAEQKTEGIDQIASCGAEVCFSEWECGAWSSPINGKIYRKCVDVNSCALKRKLGEML